VGALTGRLKGEGCCRGVRLEPRPTAHLLPVLLRLYFGVPASAKGGAWATASLCQT